jgi:hypothetical protein
MKKMMIAAAIVCAAAFAQAATVQWNSGTIYVAKDAAGTTGEGNAYKATIASGARPVTAYVYELTLEAYTAALAMDTAALYDTYFGKVDTKVAAKTTVGTGIASPAAYTVADNSTVYGLVLYVDTANVNLPDGKDAFVKAALASADVGTTAVSVSNMITDHVVGDGSWTAVPVPEPTSGLLLLLGVAGMALRRRRA